MVKIDCRCSSSNVSRGGVWIVVSRLERCVPRVRKKDWDREQDEAAKTRKDSKKTQQKRVPLSGGAEDVAPACVAIQKLERRKKRDTD